MRTVHWLVLMLLLVALPGCEAIASIFRAGMWAGVIGILFVALLVGFIVSRVRRG